MAVIWTPCGEPIGLAQIVLPCVALALQELTARSALGGLDLHRGYVSGLVSVSSLCGCCQAGGEETAKLAGGDWGCAQGQAGECLRRRSDNSSCMEDRRW